jgi:molecular chaperone DnaK
MVRDAQAHADEDKRNRELADLRNLADNLAYTLEKTVKDNREKLPESDVKAAEGAIDDARKAAQGDDAAALTSAVERLGTLSRSVTEILYKAASSTPPGGSAPQGTGAASAEAVVDAEYSVQN